MIVLEAGITQKNIGLESKIEPKPSYYVEGWLKDDVTGAPIVGATLTLVELGIWTMSATSGRFIFDADWNPPHDLFVIPAGTYTLQIDPRFPDDYEPVTLEIDVPEGADLGTILMHSPTSVLPPPLPPPGEAYIDETYYQKKGDSNWYLFEDGLVFGINDFFQNKYGDYSLKIKVDCVNTTGSPIMAQVWYQNSGGAGGTTPADWFMKNRASENRMGETKTFSIGIPFGGTPRVGANVYKICLVDYYTTKDIPPHLVPNSDGVYDRRTFNYEVEI